MTGAYRPIPVSEVLAALPAKRRARIAARAEDLVEQELALRDLRLTRRITQDEVARRVGGKQVYISRLEKRADMKLSTLREYIGALGGELQLMVTFPEGAPVRLKEPGSDRARGSVAAGTVKKPAARREA